MQIIKVIIVWHKYLVIEHYENIEKKHLYVILKHLGIMYRLVDQKLGLWEN